MRGLRNTTRLAVTLSVCLAGVASGDVFDPPGWGDAPNATRQTWSFGQVWQSDNGNAADAGAWNPNGTPYGSAAGATDPGRWLDMLDTRQGIMALNSGPLSGPPDMDQFVTFTVQNTAHVDRTKEYWVKVIYKGSIRARVAATLNGTFQEVSMNTSDSRGLADGWTERVYTGSLPDCPPFENFKIINSRTMGQTFIDSVEIHTRCIPTPAGVTLILLGGVAVARRRR
jgi:hypothetical protein